MKVRQVYLATSLEETKLLAKNFAHSLSGENWVAFYGDVGAGKTTFIKSLISALTGKAEDTILSPSFPILLTYEANPTIYHWDFYRITAEQEILNSELYEYLCSKGLTLVEWADKIPSLIPEHATLVELYYIDKLNHRQIVIKRDADKFL